MMFNGTWKADRGENIDQFMEKMGVNAMMRKLAENNKLEITIAQTDDVTFKVTEPSILRKRENEFSLGVPFDFTMADGTDVSGYWVMEGHTMKGTFTRKDNGKILTIIREIVGDELVQSFNYDGVDAKRFFKKV
ncbi:fatty acid-binding protein, intestinal-like [Conger conger]|uniref:fatty acid-binding protein, intestinal-like n=1 Tax=Conger conger TaxID=82655 RepID=UPI002A5A50DF|nr:fatty acid-binding protein, intestinal-like [Conger conger]